MRQLLLILVSLFLIPGCASQKDDKAAKVWSAHELKGLQGKTREEIRELLGEPKGLYTYDSKDRWHYSKVFIDGDRPGEPEQVALLIYFSKFGEHRATIVEIRRNPEE